MKWVLLVIGGVLLIAFGIAAPVADLPSV
jgi:hypothetical protein